MRPRLLLDMFLTDGIQCGLTGDSPDNSLMLMSYKMVMGRRCVNIHTVWHKRKKEVKGD